MPRTGQMIVILTEHNHDGSLSRNWLLLQTFTDFIVLKKTVNYPANNAPLGQRCIMVTMVAV